MGSSEWSVEGEEMGRKMLWLAGCMLDTLVDYRTKGGERISARIGIGAGQVVVGALGSLQPRVHIMGDAMREAEQLEQQGTHGMVHVSERLVQYLCGESSDGWRGRSRAPPADAGSASTGDGGAEEGGGGGEGRSVAEEWRDVVGALRGWEIDEVRGSEEQRSFMLRRSSCLASRR